MGFLVSAFGSIVEGESAAGAAEYNAQIARQNAVVAEQQGVAASEQQSIAARRKIGSMVAGYGASGVVGGSGSAMDVLADSVRAATLDNLNVKYNYQLKAMGYRNQASLDDSNAKNSRTAGVFKAVGGVMDGAAAAYTAGAGSAIPKFG